MESEGDGMDNSVSGYFQKRTTEELCAILNYCLNNFKSYEYVILDILKTLEQRLSPKDLSVYVMPYLTRLRLKKDEKTE